MATFTGPMQDPLQTSDDPAAVRELHEQIGYARCELDLLRARVAELQRQRDELELYLEHDLRRQLEVVQSEVELRRRELAERLGEWCALDELDQRYVASAALIRRVEAVRSSLTYRITAAVLLGVNGALGLLTLRRWRRGGAASRPSAAAPPSPAAAPR